MDNVGKINSDTTRNYYLKDHLGSIRVVLNSTNTVISAQDYDAWGYPLENRTYNSSAMKYDFTGKERDEETSYDYFGARYYDSRIGRWGQVEPLLDKNVNFTSYGYSSDNPVVMIDFDGNDDYYYAAGNALALGGYVDNNKPDKYYVQSGNGNIMHNGDYYYQANSLQTVEAYTNWNKVDENFESGAFVEAFNNALSGEFAKSFEGKMAYVITESREKGLIDQKNRVLNSDNTLFILNKIAYNKNEAGNIVWGAVMASLNFSEDDVLAMANIYSVLTKGVTDENEELKAIRVGWHYYHDNMKEK